MSTGNSNSECRQFRPQPLRPDRCRHCFGDKSKHPTTEATNDVIKQEASDTTAAAVGTRKNEERIGDLEKKLASCESAKSELETRCKKLTDELETTRNTGATGVPGGQIEQLEQLRSRVERAEAERDEACEELKNLQREMEEMHDNFKEEESEQFEQVKQELDLATKNCKILQIRLSKAERQYGQLEQVKTMLERQLEQLTTSQPARRTGEDESGSGHSPIGSFAAQIVSPDTVRLSTSEYDQLLRDLNDTIERERDLQEQIKYSQEEAQSKGDRLQAIEAENEVLLTKVSRLTLANSRLRSDPMRCSVEMKTPSGGEAVTKQQVKALDDQANLIEQTESLKLALDLSNSECERLRIKCAASESSLRESETRALRLEQELTRLSITGNSQVRPQRPSSRRSQSVESPDQGFNEDKLRQLIEERDSLRLQNAELEARVKRAEAQLGPHEATRMESDLLDKLKNQLETSESELARAKSRLVELDLECSRVQREHKRLLESLDSPPTSGDSPRQRTVKLPPEAARDSMSRQDLRRVLKELDDEAEQLIAQLRSRDCLVRELKLASNGENGEDVKSLSRLLDQERLLTGNLKFDLGKLEQVKQELETNCCMLERERVVMQEELAQMRQVNEEMEQQVEDAKQANSAYKDLQMVCDKLRSELANAQQQLQRRERSSVQADPIISTKEPGTPELVLMQRDFNELKVKNGFLMRQLEAAREDASRQLEDMRQAQDAQQRRAVEVAQLELKERHLTESQQLRDELQELKRRLATSQRQVARADEEVSSERDRLRSMERDWRRDKSQWQQRVEQLEAQLTLERRSNEFKIKEWDSIIRDKDRELINVQDKYVQLERDFKRLQNKHNLLEENSEAKEKSLLRELDAKKREFNELSSNNQMREDEYYANCKRFNTERATLMEALDSIKRSYDEKLAELKSTRELLSLRQEQYFKERACAQEQIEHLEGQLIKMSEQDTQTKLLRQQLQTIERQLDNSRREAAQVKEDRHRIKSRYEELERRCQAYEKQELLAKTSTISGAAVGYSSKSPVSKLGNPSKQEKVSNDEKGVEKASEMCAMIEKLSSKINDQRHLINMLKQQVDELQMEIKQLRLLQSGERSKWQSRVAQLTGKLNEAEERLMFELSAMANSSRETLEGARQRAGAKWAEERQMSLELIQQQQSQNEQLTRDLKKLAQSYDLLRLQSKQLESHNNKLSRRLIEYQQQGPVSGKHSGDRVALDLCMAERESLLARQDQLTKMNKRLVNLMRAEAQPLVETVSKMIASLDGSPESGVAADKKQNQLASPSDKPVSTHRPLLTGSTGNSPTDLSVPSSIQQQQHETPAIGQKQPSRFARFLGAKQINATQNPSQVNSASDATSQKNPAEAGEGKQKKVVKRVRVKSAALGISATEKKQLRKHLDQLASALEDLGADLERLEDDKPITGNRAKKESVTASAVNPQQQIRAFSADRTIPQQQPTLPRTSRGSSHTHSLIGDPTDSGSDYNHPQRFVRWQLQPGEDSDIESNKSYQSDQPTADSYKRFPLTTPYHRHYTQTGGASLTDYESESSLASYATDDFAKLTGRRFVSGTESDSCVGSAGSNVGSLKLKSSTGTKKRTSGLKTKLTTTLRNISRSITGLASDSEAEGGSSTVGRKRKDTVAGKATGGDNNRSGREGDIVDQTMQEIRV